MPVGLSLRLFSTIPSGLIPCFLPDPFLQQFIECGKMASNTDRIPLIDLSEFLTENHIENIKKHLQKFGGCNEIHNMKLLGSTGFDLPLSTGIEESIFKVKYSPVTFNPYLGKEIVIDALKALLPEPGQQRTIQRLELPLPQQSYWPVENPAGNDDPSKIEAPRGSLIVECLSIYALYHGNCSSILPTVQKFFTHLHSLQGINVHHGVLVCFYNGYLTSLNPDQDQLLAKSVPEGVQVEFKMPEPLKLEGYHIPYVVQTPNRIKDVRMLPIDHKSMQYLQLRQIHDDKSRGNGVIVALLTTGYNYFNRKHKFVPKSTEIDITESEWNVVTQHNFNSEFSPVHESFPGLGSTLTNIVSEVAPEAKLVLCRTTLDARRHIYQNGATSRALNWLRRKWKEREWGEGVHSLVVLIPYGGHYREDEVRAINEAIDDGIIVVCAAGSTTSQLSGKGIAFPASMGNVICVGELNEKDEPAYDSPSGREVDCLVPGTNGHYDSHFVKGTGISATILCGIIALILSFIESSLREMPGNFPPEYNHVSIIREVLQQTTTSVKHHPHSGYGLLTSRIFSFSKHQLHKLLSSITRERSFWTIPNSASEITEQCKFNSEILSNNELNSELQLPVSLDGGGVTVAVIDDDFPETLKKSYKAGKLQTEMKYWDKCAASIRENARLLKEKAECLKETASFLEDKAHSINTGIALELKDKSQSIEEQLQYMSRQAQSMTEQAQSIQNQARSMEESQEEDAAFKYAPTDEVHGLQCTLVLANIAPETELLLVNSANTTDQAPSAATILANKIEELLKLDKRPDVIVCSLGFDQFNLKLSQAINKVINAGIIPVFSAGNIGLTGSNTISYPVRLGNVLCIGAHTWHGTSHSFSSVGREVDFLAPGEFMILDKYPVSGTSFAAPAVAAFIALILQYVDKVVSGEWKHRPLEEKYKLIEAWSEDQSGSKQWGWNKIPLNTACRNVYVMRELLRQMSVHRTEHSDLAGYGNLDIRRLLKDLEPEDIHSVVQNFHKHSP